MKTTQKNELDAQKMKLENTIDKLKSEFSHTTMQEVTVRINELQEKIVLENKNYDEWCRRHNKLIEISLLLNKYLNSEIQTPLLPTKEEFKNPANNNTSSDKTTANNTNGDVPMQQEQQDEMNIKPILQSSPSSSSIQYNNNNNNNKNNKNLSKEQFIESINSDKELFNIFKIIRGKEYLIFTNNKHTSLISDNDMNIAHWGVSQILQMWHDSKLS